MDKRFTSNNLEDYLLYYSYYFSPRRLNSQKERVYRFLIDKFQNELGYRVDFGAVKVGFGKCGYCVLGDLKKAGEVYVAPLDTSRRTWMPGYRNYLINEEKKRKTDLLADAIDIVIAFALILAAYLLLRKLTSNYWIISGVITVIMLIYNLALMNKFTFNRNAAMALISTLAARQKDEKTAYVFLDRCADSFYGLRMFLAENKETLRKAKVVYFDCMASGRELVYASVKKTGIPKVAGSKNLILDSSEAPKVFNTFNELTVVFTADEENGLYSVNNIRKPTDKKVDVKRLKEIIRTFSRMGEKK